MAIYHIIYKTINLVNNHYYIGKHETNNLEDDYLGSGDAIIHAIKKYGKENFIRETLYVFDNVQEMNEKEKEIVDINLINDPLSYNIILGGLGGVTVLKKGHPKYEETCAKISKSRSGKKFPNFCGKKHPNVKIIVATFEDKHKEIHIGYNQFAKERGLNPRHLHDLSRGIGKSHKGIVKVELYKYSERLYKRLLNEIPK